MTNLISAGLQTQLPCNTNKNDKQENELGEIHPCADDMPWPVPGKCNSLWEMHYSVQEMATYYVLETVKHILLSGRIQRKPQPCLRKVRSKTVTVGRILVSMCAAY